MHTDRWSIDRKADVSKGSTMKYRVEWLHPNPALSGAIVILCEDDVALLDVFTAERAFYLNDTSGVMHLFPVDFSSLCKWTIMGIENE